MRPSGLVCGAVTQIILTEPHRQVLPAIGARSFSKCGVRVTLLGASVPLSPARGYVGSFVQSGLLAGE